MCNYLNITNAHMQRYIKHCKTIAPYAKFYKKQIEYYNHTAYKILQNEIQVILPDYNNNTLQMEKICSHNFRQHCV